MASESTQLLGPSSNAPSPSPYPGDTQPPPPSFQPDTQPTSYEKQPPFQPPTDPQQASYPPQQPSPYQQQYQQQYQYQQPYQQQQYQHPPQPMEMRVTIEKLKPTEWKYGLCDCFANCGMCCVTWFFPCITYGTTFERANLGSCIGYGCAYCLIRYFCCPCYCCYAGANRKTLRKKYNLKKEPCDDCCVHCWCHLCAICQEYNEVTSREDHKLEQQAVYVHQHPAQVPPPGAPPPGSYPSGTPPHGGFAPPQQQGYPPQQQQGYPPQQQGYPPQQQGYPPQQQQGYPPPQQGYPPQQQQGYPPPGTPQQQDLPPSAPPPT